jgi:hypothetical protein
MTPIAQKSEELNSTLAFCIPFSAFDSSDLAINMTNNDGRTPTLAASKTIG